MSCLESKIYGRLSGASRWIPVSLFFLFLAVGYLTYRDYGIYLDEPMQRETGAISYVFVLERLNLPLTGLDWTSSLPRLKDYIDGDHGAIFEMVTVFVEQIQGLTDSRDIYLSRHLSVFVLFAISIVTLYHLASGLFTDWSYGLLASLMLVLTPRLYGEAFYNSKDIVFLSLFVISMSTMRRFTFDPSYANAIIHAITTAIAFDVRVMAIILIVSTLSLAIVPIVAKRKNIRRRLRPVAVFLFALAIFIVIFWPWLWDDPARNILKAFRNLSKFRWPHDEYIFNGDLVDPRNLPWYYAPLWIAITTPAFFCVLFLTGIIQTIGKTIFSFQTILFDRSLLFQLITCGLFVLPLLAVVFLHSVLYDGWRHLYFIYPAFIIIAVAGWKFLWTSFRIWRPLRLLLVGMTAAVFCWNAAWTYLNHPFQFLYFNFLAGENLISRFEVDYWGLANRQALEYIAQHDSSNHIDVSAGSFTELAISVQMLEKKLRDRFIVSKDKMNTTYVITNYRDEFDTTDRKYRNAYDEFHVIRIGDEVAIRIYKRKN